MADFPGWDSLPAVTRHHNWAEALGIGFLALLVAAELVSHKYAHAKEQYHKWAERFAIAFLALLVIADLVAYKYGHRKDELAEQQQTATNQRHEEDMARLKLETARIQERAAELEREAAKARAEAAEATSRAKEAELKTQQTRQRRTLDPIKFKSALAYAPGVSVEIYYWASSPESMFLAVDLKNMLSELDRSWQITKFDEISHFPENLYFPMGADISSGIIMEYDASFGQALENPTIYGLWTMYKACLGGIGMSASPKTDVPARTVRIYIGPKL